jgi:HPt (histidine-containing phosphotransfer) domain-containing protein
MRRSAFDLAGIEAQWGAPPDEIFHAVLKIFVTEVEPRCVEARVALSEGRRDTLRRVAHTLKSASSNVGAVHLAECAAALETATEIETDETLGKLLARVQSAWEAVAGEFAAGGPVAHGF